MCVSWLYHLTQKGYKCLYPPTRRIYVSRHVVFDEGVLPFTEPAHLYDNAPIQRVICTFSDWMTPPYIRPASDIPSINTSSPNMDNSHHILCVPTHTHNCEPNPNHGPCEDIGSVLDRDNSRSILNETTHTIMCEPNLGPSPYDDMATS
jgi:hypothetical protein